MKIPFNIVVTWTDDQNIIALDHVQPIVPVDAAVFAMPATFKPK